MTRRPSDLKAAGRFFQQAIPPRKFVPFLSPKIAFLSLNAPTIPFLPPLPSLFLQSNLPSPHVFPNQRFLVVSQVKPIESAIRLLSTEVLGAKVKIKKEEKRKKKREELSPSLSNGHLDPSPTAARGKRARSHPRVPFVPFRCTRGERGRRRDARLDRRVPWDSPVCAHRSECPGRDARYRSHQDIARILHRPRHCVLRRDTV